MPMDEKTKKAVSQFYTNFLMDPMNPETKIMISKELINTMALSITDNKLMSISEKFLVKPLLNKIIINQNVAVGAFKEKSFVEGAFKAKSSYDQIRDSFFAKEIATLRTNFGFLPHECSLFMTLNDNHYPFSFLAPILADLPPTYSETPTLDRYRESMHWIERTIDKCRDVLLSQSRKLAWLWAEYTDLPEKLDNLKQLFQLICAEDANMLGFDIPFIPKKQNLTELYIVLPYYSSKVPLAKGFEIEFHE